MEEAGFSAVFIEKNGSNIELIGYRHQTIQRAKDIELRIGDTSIPINDHITFSVNDMEATVSDLQEKGVIFDGEQLQLEGGMKLASFKDPNGVLIELLEHS